MFFKKLLKNSAEANRVITITIPPSVRYALAAVMLIAAVVFAGFTAKFATASFTSIDEAEEIAPHWVKENCVKSLKAANFDPIVISDEAVQVPLDAGEAINEKSFLLAQVALKTCPGMEMSNLCLGSCGAVGESMFLRVITK